MFLLQTQLKARAEIMLHLISLLLISSSIFVLFVLGVEKVTEKLYAG